jgi:hypothetical protein
MQIRTETLPLRCWRLALAIGGLWLLAVIPARSFFGAGSVEAATVSAVCCLTGGCLAFWFAARLSRPRLQTFAVLIATAFRGFCALIGAIVMQVFMELPPETYLIWLGFFYLVSLALETAMMLGPRASSGAN